MTFEEFVREEEEREKQRRDAKLASEAKRLTEDTKRVKRDQLRKSYDERKAAQRAQLDRIMNEATDRYRENKKRVYDLSQPLNEPEPWLVFDRQTGDLLGEATTLRAYQAWAEVSPAKDYNACRCVLRSEWERAEAAFRNKKRNGKG